MADQFNPLIQELFGIFYTVWGAQIVLPGTSASSNIFTSVQACKLSLVQEVYNYENTTSDYITPPYIVLQIGRFVDDTGWCPVNSYKRAPVDVFYVIPEFAVPSGGLQGQDYVNGQLYLLQNYIDSRGQTVGDVPFVNFVADNKGTIDSSESNPVNRSLMADSKVTMLAGCLSYMPGFLVGDL